jgi:two-component system, OmpR family, phosphate regulon sensor histidine kinase PhoR
MVLIVFMTAVPLAAALWLGWQLLERDRVLEDQRMQERVDLAADSLVVTLLGAISSSEQRLMRGETNWPAGAVALTFSGNHVEAYPNGRLAYFPLPLSLPEATPDLFTAGDKLEFVRQDFPAAIDFFRGLSTSSDDSIRASAWLRMGRNLARLGRTNEALKAYKELNALDHVAVGGIPASLAGRYMRCELLQTVQRDAEFQAEVEVFAGELRAGRWHLTGPQYWAHSRDLARWTGRDIKENLESEALAAAAMVMWERRQSLAKAGREMLAVEGRNVVTLWQGTAESMRVLVAAPEFVRSQWIAPAEFAAGEQGVSFQLDSPHPEEDSRGVTRLAKQTELPWNISVTGNTLAHSATFALRRRLLVAGFALLTGIALTASFLIILAVRRERAVAKMQSDFVATVSHEFRTPLTALHQFTEMLRDSERLAPEQGKERRLLSYDAQSRATSRLTRLVEQLLDFRRLEGGNPRYNLEPQDSTEFVWHVVNDFRPTAEALGYDVRFSGNGAAMIDADSEALGRALLNLLDNAVKYSPGRQMVEVVVHRSAGEVVIDVRDQGIGIPLSEHTLIFGKFQRGEEARKRGVKGTGIGLAMVEEIVAAHHGRVKLDSEPGKGSTFTIVLPVREVKDGSNSDC